MQWSAMTSEIKSTRLNLLFDTVLQSFRAAQKEGALIIPLTLGNITKTVTSKKCSYSRYCDISIGSIPALSE